jgi:hypothetical protein
MSHLTDKLIMLSMEIGSSKFKALEPSTLFIPISSAGPEVR